MVRRFFASNAAFNGEFAQFLEQERGTGDDVAGIVTGILKDVQARGGEAVAEYTARFDGLQLDPSTLTSDNVNLHSLAAECPADLREAIDFAHDRIAAYHAVQRPADHSFTDSAGIELGWRWTALESVGVYVPGGRASYPSSVLMNVVPAKIAGVERIVMVAPAPQGELSPAVAYAAIKAGVEEFYPIGGAQAVAALAYGTANLASVDKIVGPGNAFVAEAKRQVFGRVGIDTIAGPSEILVIADHTANPDWIAADLLSQAEHDPSSQSILIVVDQAVGDSVENSVESQLKTLPTGERARESWINNGAIVVAPDLPTAATIANRIAAEHLELAVED
ncbi:MAG: histidinol dehydrogenase, partial [Hyphomonas sp.]|nr:histidinol dehydrogenase [Hyphomonas sp.]